MKLTNDKKNERTTLIEKMQVIVGRMETEKDATKRSADQSEWDGINTEIEALDAEIKVLERQDELNKTIVARKPVARKSEEEKVASEYNMLKAIKTFGTSKFDGLEREMHEEGIIGMEKANQSATGLVIPQMVLDKTVYTNKADITTSNQSNWVNTQAARNIDIMQTRPLFEELGVTQYKNIEGGKMPLPYDAESTAYFVDESSTMTGVTVGNTNSTLEAVLVGNTAVLTGQFLKQTDPSIAQSLMQNWINGLDRATMKRALSEFNALTPLAAYTGSTGVTYQMFVDLLTNVEQTDDSFKYVTSKSIMGSSMTTAVDSGSGVFIWNGNNNTVLGNPAYGTSLGTAKHIYAGLWSKMAVGFFGGVQLIYDPYSAKSKGNIEVAVQAYRDTAFSNPNAFKHIELA